MPINKESISWDSSDDVPVGNITWDAPTAGLDTTSGAPAGLRSLIASATSPQAKLDALRRYYPDAQVYEGDNFIFTDPETGSPTVFNPKGFDVGDVAEFGRAAAETLGGGVGGALALAGGQVGPQVATPEELVTVPAAVGAGATLAGELYDRGTRSLADIPEERGPAAQTLDAATSFGVNAVGQRAGEIAQTKLQNFPAWASQARDNVTEAFRAIGVDPTAAAVSGRKLIQAAENALGGLPLSADVVGDKYAKMMGQMDNFVRGWINTISQKSGTTEIGRSIEGGIKNFVGKFTKTGGELYDEIWKKLPQDQRIGMPAFIDEVGLAKSRFSEDPAFKGILDSPVMKKFADAIEAGDGTVSVQTLKGLRTQIGERMNDSNLLGDTTQAELKRLYRALSNDIEAAAGAAGATKEFTRANEFWRAGRGRIDDILNPIMKGNTVDDIYNAVFGNEVRNLKTQSPSTIRALMKSVPESQRRDIAGEFVRRMGMPTPGIAGAEGVAEGFNPSRYLTNYNTMLPSVRRAVFGGVRGLPDAMDNLATATASVKDIQKMSNPSGTARQTMAMNLLLGIPGLVTGGAEGAAGALMAGHAATFPAAKLMTSTRFINWLADAARVEVSNSPAAIGPLLTRLYAIGEVEPEIAAEIDQYATMFRDAVPVETP